MFHALYTGGDASIRDRPPKESDSRVHLRRALSQLDASDAPTWVARARAELQAAGDPVPESPEPAASTALTSQELKIAQLAATGLSMRTIAQTLYISHPTVGAHLYTAYRKLEITRRSELEEALR